MYKRITCSNMRSLHESAGTFQSIQHFGGETCTLETMGLTGHSWMDETIAKDERMSQASGLFAGKSWLNIKE